MTCSARRADRPPAPRRRTRRTKADVVGFALGVLGVDAAQAVMVGDRAQDIAGAHAHGMRSIGVRWGYANPGELEEAGADAVVDTPPGLVEILTGMSRERG